MSNLHTAVKCAACGTLHERYGRYITVTATVQEQPPMDGGRREPESVKVVDVAVCNNRCLLDLLALKGFY